MDNEIMDNSKNMFEALREGLDGDSALRLSDIEMLNPLALAYVGDAVYDTFVRSYLVTRGLSQVAKLHKKSIGFVKAKAQAEILSKISGSLTEEEGDVVRRGRNTKAATVPKNADLADYRHATGLEALIGYLFLTGRTDRLVEILRKAIEAKDEGK